MIWLSGDENPALNGGDVRAIQDGVLRARSMAGEDEVWKSSSSRRKEVVMARQEEPSLVQEELKSRTDQAGQQSYNWYKMHCSRQMIVWIKPSGSHHGSGRTSLTTNLRC